MYSKSTPTTEPLQASKTDKIGTTATKIDYDKPMNVLYGEEQFNFNEYHHFKEEAQKIKVIHDPCKPRSDLEHEGANVPLTVVTATSQGFLNHLQNLVGSMHVWAPGVQLVVYDLGIKKKIDYCNVTVVKFPFKDYPVHVKKLRNFAWKALVIDLATQAYGKVLYLDSGYELRQPLGFIQKRIEKDGYFCTGMGDTMTRGSRDGLFKYFNTTSQDFYGKPMVAGGVSGLTYWGGAYEAIIKPAVECSKDPKCIMPTKPGNELRSFGKDQPLFSLLVYKNWCVQCHMDTAFTDHRVRVKYDPLKVGRQVLFHRRNQGKSLYKKHAKNKEKGETCFKEDVNAKLWSHQKAQFHHQDRDHPCTCQGSTMLSCVKKNKRPVTDVTTTYRFVTAVQKKDMRMLQNLAGSLQHHAPGVKIIVYPLDDETQSILESKDWDNLFIDTIDWEHFPGYVRDYSTLAFLPVVWKTAADKYNSFFWLMPGYEIQNSIDPLSLLLNRDGMFASTIWGDTLEGFKDSESIKAFYNELNLDPKDFKFRPLCTANHLGFKKGSWSYNSIIIPSLACALDKECWDTLKPSKKAKSKVDMLVSTLIYNSTCYTCNRDHDYYAWSGQSKSTDYRVSKPLDVVIRGSSQILYNRWENGDKESYGFIDDVVPRKV